MCAVSGDEYVCESPECVALGLERAGIVRGALADFLRSATNDCLADVAVAVDVLLSEACESGQRPVKVELVRRPETQTCWLTVAGCSTETGERVLAWPSNEVALRILNGVCTSWGAVPGGSEYTLWAELPLVSAEDARLTDDSELPTPRVED